MALLTGGILNGIILGGIYSLIVFGVVMIYGFCGFPNLAIGPIGLFAAYVTNSLIGGVGWIAAILIGMVIAVGIGMASQRFIFTRIREGAKTSDESLFLVTFVSLAFGIILQTLLPFLFVNLTANIGIPSIGTIIFAGYTFTGYEILAISFSFVLLGLLAYMMRKTAFGRSIYATAQNADLAKLTRVNTRRLYDIVMGLACLFGFIAILLYGVIFNITTSLGLNLSLYGFIMAVVGGVGHLYGAYLAAFIIGLSLSIGSLYIPGTLYKVVFFVIFIIVLIFKPQGLIKSELGI